MPHFRALLFLCFLLIIAPIKAVAQEPDTLQVTGDSLRTQVPDSAAQILLPDSLAAQPDSLSSDSLQENKRSSFLDQEIEYQARDSIVYDLSGKQMELYGESKVTYGTIKLDAERIDYKFEDYLVKARGVEDTAGVLQGKPVFVDGGTTYNSQSMDYNFKSKKGYIRMVETKVSEGYLSGTQVKTTDNNNVVYIKRAEFCPCEDPNARTRFKISKVKLIKDKQIIAGPGYLSFYDIPTPLAFPFGFFPSVDKQQAGILIPSFGDSRDFGLFLQNLGFYVPIGQYLDNQTFFDVYSSGSFQIQNTTRYVKKYRFDGGLNFTYNKFRSGDEDFQNLEISGRYFLQWRHNQSPQAHPNRRFSADVSVGSTNTFRNDLGASQQAFLTNTFNSGINYSKAFPGSPFTLSASARHSQNSTTGNYNITLPDLSLNMARINPLEGLSNKPGKPAWYEGIGVNYSMRFSNTLDAPDSLMALNKIPELLNRVNNGVLHTSQINNSFKLGYFTINPSLSVNHRWYFYRTERFFNELTQLPEQVRVGEFNTATDASLSTGVNTKIYGMYTFKRGRVQAIRHVLTPNISMSYRPDFSTEELGFTGSNGAFERYNPYQGSPAGVTPSGEAGIVSLNLINNLEAKVFTPKDTANRFSKMPLLENVSFNTSYNLMADSLNLSPLNISARTTILKTIQLSYQSSWSYYGYDPFNGRTINRLEWDSNRRLARNTSQRFGLQGSLRSKNRDTPPPDQPQTEIPEEELEFIERNPGLFVDFSVPWTLTFNYSVSITERLERDPAQDSDLLVRNRPLVQTLSFSGDMRFFKKAMLTFNSGYDFELGEFTTTTLALTVDLNCWELSANVIPFGARASFGVSVNIKSALLRDLKIQRRGQIGNEQNFF